MSFLKNIAESIQQNRAIQHLVFWFAIMLIAIPKRLLDIEMPFLISFVGDVCLIIPQILASYFTAYIIFSKLLLKRKYLISILLLIVSAYVVSVIGRIIIVYIGEPLVRVAPFEQESFVEILVDIRYLALAYVIDIYTIVFVFLFVKYFKNYKDVKEKELASKSEKVAAELKTLKAQLNPHFLFNTLNNIYVLSLENSPKAPKSIEKLSKILDHVLYRCNT
ncbi:MAG: histidine kinase, partial [Flavobacteriaceae bacterium]|nr:histidine kinase [Flavobacteriaceae bacterium]